MRRLRILLVLSLAVAQAACGSTQEVGATGKLELQREELVRLKRDIVKVDKSIDVTKELIRRSKGERYLPDLYFRLAELYIEKSRLVYFRILEEAGADDKAAVVAPEARLLKDQAIAVYRRILSEFPEYLDNDKITFFIAHEYRELGNFPEMIKTYEELITKYPKSNFRFEAWLILGDYHFDKGDIDEGIANYRAILKGAETYAHNMARYKLAWCYINKDKTNLAVDLWEQAVKTPPTVEPGIEVTDALLDKPGRLEVRQEALRDLAYYYAEARDPKGALAFFQDLTVSRQEYRTALERLAKRFQIKTMYEESAKVYRELVRVSADVDRNLEWAEAIYESAVAAKDLAHADEDVIMLSEVSARYKYWWRANDEDKKVLKDFEMLTRDLSTRLHALAKEKNDAELFGRAAKAYASYLSVFDDSPERVAMEWNYAETLYAAKKFVKAGGQYEGVLKLLEQGAPEPAPVAAAAPAAGAKPDAKADPKADPKAPAKKDEKKDEKKAPTPGSSAIATTSGSVDGDKKQAIYSAILAYFEALKIEEKGSRYDSMMAREGIKDLGGRFVTKYPDDPNTPNVKFNVARAYFEQGLFDKSIELFTAFVKEYPQNKDAATAAELTLDAYNQKEDFSGLAKVARVFAAEQRLADPAFRERFAKMAEQAEQEEINRKTIQAEGNVSKALESFIVEKKGTEVAAKALYQAFVIARDRRNIADMTQVGRQLLEEYSNQKYAKEVLPSLAEQSLRTSQLEQAAGYYEEYARRYPEGEAADDLLDGAAQIRDQLGEYAAAMSDYERLTKQGDEGRKPLWLAKLAETALKAGDWRRAEEAALQIADNGAHAVLANAIAGEAAMKTGKPDVASERLAAAVGAAAKGRGTEDGPEWIGRSQYLMGEIVRADFERVQFKAGDEATALQEKFGLLEELQATYVDAIKAGDPEWAMGALYRIAMATRQAAEFLESAPAPQGASADEEKQYRAALAERAAPLKKQASDALEQCRNQSRKLEAFNRFTKACVTGAAVQEDADNPRPRPPGVAIPGREQMEAKLIENPKDLATLQQLIRAAIQVKDYPLAKLLAGKALELDEKNAALHNLQGIGHAGSNDMQSAAASFKKALRYDSKYAPALANMGTLYALYGDDSRAKDLFSKAGGFDTSSPDVLPQAAAARGGAK
jgi:cellulose synthase operon protein C